MTNSVTNQNWKLWLTSGCLTPVNHLSCISRGHCFSPSHFDIWLCSCVKSCVLAPRISLVMSPMSSAPVFWTCSRTCSARSHVVPVRSYATPHVSFYICLSDLSLLFATFSETFPEHPFSLLNQNYWIFASMTLVVFFLACFIQLWVQAQLELVLVWIWSIPGIPRPLAKSSG